VPDWPIDLRASAVVEPFTVPATTTTSLGGVGLP
jgi:hypothetical protein